MFCWTGIKAAALIGIALLAFSPAMAQTSDEETPAAEYFCDDNFDGRLRGLCNAFCEAMDCDSLEGQASASACLKLEEKIAPLLAADNAQYDPDLEITMANPMTGKEGNCGLLEVCTQQARDACASQNLEACSPGSAECGPPIYVEPCTIARAQFCQSIGAEPCTVGVGSDRCGPLIDPCTEERKLECILEGLGECMSGSAECLAG